MYTHCSDIRNAVLGNRISSMLERSRELGGSCPAAALSKSRGPGTQIKVSPHVQDAQFANAQMPLTTMSLPSCDQLHHVDMACSPPPVRGKHHLLSACTAGTVHCACSTACCPCPLDNPHSVCRRLLLICRASCRCQMSVLPEGTGESDGYAAVMLLTGA